MDRHEAIRRTQWQAASWLQQHELLAEQYWDGGRGARWVIGRPKTSVHRCEIIAGIGGSLIVHGDWDVVRFGHYVDHADAWSRLQWMADCTDVDYYVAQKAAIGMSGDDVLAYYNESVARAEIVQEIENLRASSFDHSEQIAVLQEALDGFCESEHELREYLATQGNRWDMWKYEFGKVLRSHIVISHVSLGKCAALVRERHGLAGPEACRGSWLR